ncbi:hypothetical protein [Hydrogenophaga sp.]|uniref:hypothetical protein n=1 Tax=Hydrogenophaga sp. TaxID=1904254 RepID=UPI003F71AA57
MKILAPLLMVALVGCAAPSSHVASSSSIKPADERQVAQCKYLDDIVGTSAWYGMFASQGSENARQEALIRAEKIGATHIVWNQPTVLHGSTSVSGKAYRCP